MAAMAGGCLRHLIELNELADLSCCQMCIADGSNCRQANNGISSRRSDTQKLLEVTVTQKKKRCPSKPTN
jgi:hypothetical protein